MIEREKEGRQNVYPRVSAFLTRLGVGRHLCTEINLNLHYSPNIFRRIN
jgi:hypothetical protein